MKNFPCTAYKQILEKTGVNIVNIEKTSEAIIPKTIVTLEDCESKTKIQIKCLQTNASFYGRFATFVYNNESFPLDKNRQKDFKNCLDEMHVALINGQVWNPPFFSTVYHDGDIGAYSELSDYINDDGYYNDKLCRERISALRNYIRCVNNNSTCYPEIGP